jgi:hypothetical protein
VVRRTQSATALYDVAPAPDGALWALHLYKGRRVPVRIDRRTLLSEPADAPAADLVPAVPPGRLPLAGDHEYKASSPRNWTLLFAFAQIAAGNNYRGEFLLLGSAAMLAADRLRNHVLGIQAQAYGSLQLTNAEIFYGNQEHRIQWQASLFQELRPNGPTFERLGMPTGDFLSSTASSARAHWPARSTSSCVQGAVAGGVTFRAEPFWRLAGANHVARRCQRARRLAGEQQDPPAHRGDTVGRLHQPAWPPVHRRSPRLRHAGGDRRRRSQRATGGPTCAATPSTTCR